MNILEPILYAVVTTAIPIIATYISKFLVAKKEQINTQVKNEKLNKYLETALDAVNQAVLAVSQTYVDTLKENGKLSVAAQNEAKSRAVEIAASLITNDTQNAIKQLYGDFDKWLDSTIERFVNINK